MRQIVWKKPMPKFRYGFLVDSLDDNDYLIYIHFEILIN